VFFHVSLGYFVLVLLLLCWL